jgi:hypothetical protein
MRSFVEAPPATGAAKTPAQAFGSAMAADGATSHEAPTIAAKAIARRAQPKSSIRATARINHSYSSAT